jgi:hypothetical protein
MEIFALQGDQIIRKLPNPDTGKLEPARDLVIAGSHTSPHIIRGKCLTRLDGDRRFVRVARATTIAHHADRHRDTALPKGDYEIYPQRERGGNGDRAIED